jgi:hypothetical protein
MLGMLTLHANRAMGRRCLGQQMPLLRSAVARMRDTWQVQLEGHTRADRVRSCLLTQLAVGGISLWGT